MSALFNPRSSIIPNLNQVIIGGMDFTAFVQTQYATEVLGG